ncbi:MAG: TraB/GumN family protein [Saprospiraceae bacterium]|nr:TraB/GumN family protein [Saprospiraceae bacterium]
MQIKPIRNLVFFTLIFSFIFGCSTSQRLSKEKGGDRATSAESALLWKIEAGEMAPSYIFGTIHMIEKDEYFFTEEIEVALESTRELVLEIDLEEAMDLGSQIALLQKAIMRGDTTLKDLLSEEDYNSVRDHFEEMGIPFFLFEKVKPMFLTIFASEDMFSGGGLNMDEVKSYELELIEKAKKQSKPVDGLETVDYQMSIFDSIPYRAQAEMLVNSLSEDAEEANVMDTLVYYYKKQDIVMLDQLLNSDPTTNKYRTVLLDNRNANWIPIIIEKVKSQPTFFAVGAGHLAGDYGVLNLLKKEGLKLTPIRLNLTSTRI